MHYDTAQVLKRITGVVILVINSRETEFAKVSMIPTEFLDADLNVLGIGARDNKTVLTLEKSTVKKNDLNEPWVKEHIKMNGELPGFF